MAQRAARRGPLLVLYAFAHGRLPGLAVDARTVPTLIGGLHAHRVFIRSAPRSHAAALARRALIRERTARLTGTFTLPLALVRTAAE